MEQLRAKEEEADASALRCLDLVRKNKRLVARAQVRFTLAADAIFFLLSLSPSDSISPTLLPLGTTLSFYHTHYAKGEREVRPRSHRSWNLGFSGALSPALARSLFDTQTHRSWNLGCSTPPSSRQPLPRLQPQPSMPTKALESVPPTRYGLPLLHPLPFYPLLLSQSPFPFHSPYPSHICFLPILPCG